MKKGRFFTSALALSLLAGVPAAAGQVLPVLAAEETTGYSLTIENAKGNVTYYCYQVFTGTPGTVDGKQVLTDINWNADLNSAGLLAKLKNDAGLPAAVNDASGVAQWLSESDANALKFRSIIVGFLKNNMNVATYVPDEGESVVFEELNPGYYVIAEQDGVDAPKAVFIMDVVDRNKTIQLKNSDMKGPLVKA